ncbi:GerAB/ArcD/ProY family transporter [Neobacillus fumarioli]|uniref:GerAB/ArcD/ProY family transporter n=1 Tax=Neobacillus fumarioli TaxID=105229 RepID=UPI000830D119|nr:GerAB/ArcD/ProY family transporter [Neobacillus fumarioli]
MNRYFMYLMLLNMMASAIIFVPKILIDARFHGAVMSLIIAVPIGTGFSFLLSKALERFPNKGLPEILDLVAPKWLKYTVLIMLPVFWYVAGAMTLVGFIDILERFINPEAPKWMILMIYLVVLCITIELPTLRVMYLLEIILFMNSPFIFFMIYKAFTDDYMSWDSILEACTHVFEWPSLTTIATASFVFCGYTNLIIFNRLFKEKLKFWNFAAVILLGVFNLFTSYFIPIGINGIDGSHAFLYPWIATADSLRLVYSPIERAIFLFLMLYISITLMSVVVHWHVGYELISGMNEKKSTLKKWIIVGIFMAGTIPAILFLDTIALFKIAGVFMVVRLGAEVFVIALTMYLTRRKPA